MSTYHQLGARIGALTDEKNTAYGSSFAKSGDFLLLLFPDGIAPDRMHDALLLVRIFDKQMRIATDKDAFGESPFADIAGYGLLGAQSHNERKAARENEARWQDSAKVQDAAHSSKAPHDSAESSTRPQTTTGKNETAEPVPSQQPASSSRLPEVVLASTAMGPVLASAAARANRESKSIRLAILTYLERNYPLSVGRRVIQNRVSGWRGDFLPWDIPAELEYLVESGLVHRTGFGTRFTISAAGRDMLELLQRELA